MKNKTHYSQSNSLVILHNEEWLIKQRQAGKIVAYVLSQLEQMVKDQTTLSLLEMDLWASDYIRSQNATETFLNYKGFPNSVCISVNHQLVHGIPTNYKLQEGDVVSFDLGATVDGAIADSALTCIYGEPKSALHSKLVQTTKKCLVKGIEAMEIGKPIGVIGNAIYKHATKNGFGVIDKYGGHGIAINCPHASPFILNKANPNDGVRIQAGMTIAIEPLLCIGGNETKVSDDGWTVEMTSKNLCAHEEHSIFVHSDHIEIITER